MTSAPNSRQLILQRLQAKTVSLPTLPSVDESVLTTYPDPVQQFGSVLALVGGVLHHVDRPSDVSGILKQIPEFAAARQIASLVPDAVAGNVDSFAIRDPHDLSSLDWAIVPGEFMVAENGAIWIDGNALPHRAMLFVTQFLAIVVRRDQIMHNMHQAYARIGAPTTRFGVFVSGPSKTADIEQSLVLGAHGCRSLQVFVVADA